ncbi:MAG TPA: hypothetical protein VFT70_06895 [Nocardioides sp.]|nr:hypothetical protein [Nocardioides sp.]
MDNLRAMREARYARANAKPAPTSSTPKQVAPVAPVVAASDPAPIPASHPAPDGDARCGHRSMNGRTCTREAGHAAKSHRYS